MMGSVLLTADFQSDDQPGWALTDAISILVTDGELKARCIPDEDANVVIESDDDFDDVDARVTLRWEGSPDEEKAPAWAGIAVRSSDDGYYLAAISTSGLYSIYWYDDEDSGPLVDDTEHVAIDKNGPNELRFVAAGDELAFYINGTLVTTTRDDGDEPLTSGMVSLVLVSTEQPIGVSFRALELREVS